MSNSVLQASLWFGFMVLIAIMLLVDLGILNRKSGEPSTKQASLWVGITVAVTMLFTVFVFFLFENKWMGIESTLDGTTAAQQFFTAWLLEQSLGLDNVFVFALIFSYFKVPGDLQRRVLFWGILGALILRGVMIWLGLSFIAQFAAANYVLAVILIYSAIRMAMLSEEDFHPESNILFRIAKKLYPLSPNYDGEHFFIRLPDGRKAMTPLLIVLLVVESTDVVFALDSIPAVFGISHDPFIVFSSNIFAIINLRSLYFVLSSMMNRFQYLKQALVFVLIFIGVKMLLENVVHIPTYLSMIVVLSLIIGGVVLSMVSTARASKDS